MATTSRLYAKVSKFLEQVKLFFSAQESTDQAKRMIRALKGVQDALTETGTNPAEVGIDTAMVQGSLDWYEAVIGAESSNLDELRKLANSVKRNVEDEDLEEDELDIATQALTIYASVAKPANGDVVRNLGNRRPRGEKPLSEYDFPFPINVTCETCQTLVTQSGKEVGAVDWNTLRYQCQTHANKTHGMEGTFPAMVARAFNQAKGAFDDGSDQAEVPPIGTTPGFMLEKVEAA